MSETVAGPDKKTSPGLASYRESAAPSRSSAMLIKQSNLYYLMQSLHEVLDLDIVSAGDLFLTDKRGNIVYVRSNQFLSPDLLYPAQIDDVKEHGYGQAILQCLQKHSATIVSSAAESRDTPDLPLLNLVIPVVHNRQLMACVGFVTRQTDYKMSLNMIQGVIQTAIQAGIRMVEARQTIDELYLLHEFYQNLDNTAGVMILNRELNIMQTNREAEFILGMGREDLCGKSLKSLLDPVPDLEAAEEHRLEVEYRTARGRVKSPSRFTPLLNQDGIQLGWRLTFAAAPHSTRKSSSSLPSLFQFDNIIGQTPQFVRLIKLARSISRSPSNVLITGESGTGKELFAQSIHCASAYSKGPFVAINCAAIPRELIETELFGYVEGAFTGAKKHGYIGKIVQANHGTLFLDEIGDMPIELQSKLLRVLQERVVVPVGGVEPTPVDIRVISATNQELEKMIQEHTFRCDLYYRLNVINLTLPPLRERKEDIPVLLQHFLQKYTRRLGKEDCLITDRAVHILQQYNWPGNVRELENVVEMAVNLASGVVDVDHLPERIVHYQPTSHSDSDPILTLEELERMQIIKALNTFEGNITHAAEALNIGRTTLYRKIKKYNLVRLVNIAEGGLK